MSDPNNPPPDQPQQWGQQPPPPAQPPAQQWGQQPPPPGQPPAQQWGEQPPAPGQPPAQQWGQQPPAPGQPPAQQWGGPGQPQQQWGGGPPQGGGGLDPKIAGLLAYFFGWVGGLIVYLTQKNPEVRFHGAQSILMSIGIFAVYIAIAILSAIVRVFGLLLIPVWLGAFALFIFMCVQGYQQKHFKLPVIGDMAEQWASK